MPLVSVPIEKVYEDIKNTILPGGVQTALIIGNETNYEIELAGSNCGAGDVQKKWGVPTKIKPGEAKGVLVDSDGGSSQICNAYGVRVSSDTAAPRYLLMFYGYNPKLDSSEYSGLHDPAGNGKISEREWAKSRYNEGKYPASDLCENANDGTGPDWQVDTTKTPLKRYKFNNELFVEMLSSKDKIDGGSRHYVIFKVSNKEIV